MVVHAYYEEDPRVRREAEAVVASGRDVDVFALRREGFDREGMLDGVRVHRLDVQRHQGAGIGTYLLEYAEFAARALWALTRAHRRRHYALAQVASIPDALVFAALPLRLIGRQERVAGHRRIDATRIRRLGPAKHIAVAVAEERGSLGVGPGQRRNPEAHRHEEQLLE